MSRRQVLLAVVISLKTMARVVPWPTPHSRGLLLPTAKATCFFTASSVATLHRVERRNALAGGLL